MQYPITYEKYQADLKQGKFIGLKCTKCNKVTFPPMAVCRECSHTKFSPIILSGKGKIKTFTVIRVAPEGRRSPYIIGMVELEEGPYVMGNIIGINSGQASMELIDKEVELGIQEIKGDTYSLGDCYAITFKILS